jgi:arsenite methyltransferase
MNEPDPLPKLVVDETASSAAAKQEHLDKNKSNSQQIRASVQTYYGTTLQTSDDLQTNACCTAGAPPNHIKEAIGNLHPETIQKYYGCGLCLPDYDLTGLRVLDLGCGAGRDVYIASQLVGPTGSVVGVDMTQAQLEAARKHQSYHAAKFGHDNVQFVHGYLEELDALMTPSPDGNGAAGLLEPGSFDLIVSNCVLNLCTDKGAVLRSCHRLLKEGQGEMYFSDVYASRRVPRTLQADEILWGECLSGALYWNDFENLAVRCGFPDPRLVEDSPIAIQNSTVLAQIDALGHGGLDFYSATYRLLRSDLLEPDCEDYGQAVIYRGTLPHAATSWKLDRGHVFEQGRVHPVCGNTWNMLRTAPLRDHFAFVGDFSKHYGIFEGCGTSLPYGKEGAGATKGGDSTSGGGCC